MVTNREEIPFPSHLKACGICPDNWARSAEEQTAWLNICFGRLQRQLKDKKDRRTASYFAVRPQNQEFLNKISALFLPIQGVSRMKIVLQEF